MVQKRKYRPGFHWNLGLHAKQQSGHTATIPQHDVANAVEAPVAVESRQGWFEKREVAKEVHHASQDEEEKSSTPVESSHEIAEPSAKAPIIKRVVSLPRVAYERIRERVEPKEGYDPVVPGSISAIMGVSNILLMFVPILGIIISILAIYFGILALRSKNKGASMLGVLGIIFACLTLIFATFWSLFFVFGFVFAF